VTFLADTILDVVRVETGAAAENQSHVRFVRVRVVVAVATTGVAYHKVTITCLISRDTEVPRALKIRETGRLDGLEEVRCSTNPSQVRHKCGLQILGDDAGLRRPIRARFRKAVQLMGGAGTLRQTRRVRLCPSR